jgi:O-antigen/teichoic acid export membrane protein
VTNTQLRTGLSLVVVSSVAGRLASLVQQVVLAGILIDRDFGIVAAALGIFSITAILRNGGGWMALGPLRSAEFEREGPPVFWVCMAVCILGATASLLAAPGAAERFKSPELAWVLVIYSAQLMVSGFEQYSRAKVRSDLALKHLSILLSMSSLLQCGLAIGLAFGGTGPYALAIPMLAGTIFDAIVCQRLSGLSRAAYRFEWVEIKRSIRTLIPVFVLSALTSINLGIDYLIASQYLTTEALGLYSFAYRISSQPYMLLTMSLQRILVSASASISIDSAQRERWLYGMASTVFFAVPAACTSIAIAFPWADRFIWAGKWEAVHSLVAILCIGLSGPVAVGILITPLIADRRYSVVLIAEAVRSVSVAMGAALGIMFVADLEQLWSEPESMATAIAIGVSGCTTLSSFGVALWLLHASGLRLGRVLEGVLSGPLVCILSGYGAQSVGHSLCRSFDVFDGRWGAAAAGSVTVVMYVVSLVLALQLLPALRSPYENLVHAVTELRRRIRPRGPNVGG